MGRSDPRPEPTTRATWIGVAREVHPPFKASRGCGYLWTRVWTVGDGAMDCDYGNDLAAELAGALLELVPFDYLMSIYRVVGPDEPFRRCGQDMDCQGATVYTGSHGHAPNLLGEPDPFITWSVSGYHHDPTGATRSGYTRCVVTTSGAYPALPGGHKYPVATYPAWVTFVDFLASHPILFADKYGRKATPQPWVILHKNSFYQK